MCFVSSPFLPISSFPYHQVLGISSALDCHGFGLDVSHLTPTPPPCTHRPAPRAIRILP